jgi:hypothetical protein
MNIDAELRSIDWDSYGIGPETAPRLQSAIRLVFDADLPTATKAVRELENQMGLGHVVVHPLAVPVLPLLFLAMPYVDEKVLEAIMEALWAAASVAFVPDDLYPIRPLRLEWTTLPPPPSPAPHHVQVREVFLAHRRLIEPLLGHANQSIFELAVIIINRFSATPEQTFAALSHRLSQEANISRRASVYASMYTLQAGRKVDMLKQAFVEESHVARLFVASQLAYELKQACPPEVVDYLAECVLSQRAAEWADECHWLSLTGSGFFADAGIPLAICRPELYDEILDQYIAVIDRQLYAGIAMDPAILLPFGFGWHGKPDLAALSPAQVWTLESVAASARHLSWLYPTFGYYGLPTHPDQIAALLDQYLR